MLKYIILGILQGITESLPVSSSGHLVLFRHLFNVNFEDVNFEIFLNFGSFLAIFFIFRKDIIRLIKAFFSYLFNKNDYKKYQKDFKYALMIILGSIPVGITGLLFKDKVDLLSNNMTVLGIDFLITSFLLFLVRKANGNKNDYEITFKDALIIGCMQTIALLPGISRSGTVMVACLLCKLNRDSALRYTFMLYFPVSAASFLLGVKDFIKTGADTSLLMPYIIGMIIAGVITYYTFQLLTKIVKKENFWKFSIYTLIIGLFTLIYFR